MNSHHDFDDSRQLDRLVDGELAGDEYRVFLASLDNEPDGWRRCAMAFLESQAWKQELGEMRKEILLGRREAFCQPSGHNRNWSAWQVAGLMLAMAASFAVVFACGVWWQVGSSSDSPLDRPKVARQQSDSRPTALDEELSQDTDQRLEPGGIPTEHLTFVVDRDDGESERFELPIYDANDRLARQLLQGSPSMPADVERAIRDSGFQVKRQRQWARVRLRDGRRAFFPVDQLEITPVSGNIYH